MSTATWDGVCTRTPNPLLFSELQMIERSQNIVDIENGKAKNQC